MLAKMIHVKRWQAALLLFFFLACVTTINITGDERQRVVPNSTGSANYYEMTPNPNYVSLGVKGYQQTTGYTCGPAVAMSLLRWYNLLGDQDLNQNTEMTIAREMGTGDLTARHPGTSPQQMEKWLKSNGFEVTVGYNGTLAMLRENLHNGIPTLVEWIDWGGHWVIVTGYYVASGAPEEGPDTIFFADPAVHWTTVNNPDGISSFNAWRFRDMWFDAQYLNPGKLVRNVYIVAVPKKKK
ncbi:peptidase C39 family protein [Sporomusa aerivorans]|uniref:peptidase C39 family protein n=1 Tax=Sporomusa aerivorans TaxID=204936 RepID=UPI00352A9333